MNWLASNFDDVARLLAWHLGIAVPAILLSFVMALPIGWIAWRYQFSRTAIVSLAGLLYAIPSLPLLVFLPVLLGTGLRDPVNVVVLLTLYGIALQVRSTVDGFSSVSHHVLEAAEAQGFAGAGRFWLVQLPLALPVLLAGLRVVVVSTVSLVTVSAVLGTPSLGQLFTDGIQRGIAVEIATGILLTVLLAVGLDRLVLLAERALTPWVERHSRVPRMRTAERWELA